ncbi:glycine-rich cell wall structural protein 1.8-like [Hevea brasiliensis]|uniref:glycine-rich cell wall structural protein 1.8-like n=1 Tax=Hevea brasiliensis TaxID=3981 RepID=UPI0025CF3480|nr:glycine-rich cell wall structural protein 1.8-like [Hevea brasiliensis]
MAGARIGVSMATSCCGGSGGEGGGGNYGGGGGLGGGCGGGGELGLGVGFALAEDAAKGLVGAVCCRSDGSGGGDGVGSVSAAGCAVSEGGKLNPVLDRCVASKYRVSESAGRGQGSFDTCEAADIFFLLEEGDLACGVEVETPASCRLEVEVLGFLGGGSDSGVVGGSLLFERGGAEAMGRGNRGWEAALPRAKLGEGKFEGNEEAIPLGVDGENGGVEGENKGCRGKLGQRRRKDEWRRRGGVMPG